jgi:hypothetical protein
VLVLYTERTNRDMVCLRPRLIGDASAHAQSSESIFALVNLLAPDMKISDTVFNGGKEPNHVDCLLSFGSADEEMCMVMK